MRCASPSLENEKPVGRHDGVANFGIRPMYQTPVPLMEAHLFDFDGDLYGKHLSVELIAYLRPEAKFDEPGRPDRPDRRRCPKSPQNPGRHPKAPKLDGPYAALLEAPDHVRTRPSPEAHDYRASLFLPATDFPMKAGPARGGAQMAGALGGHGPLRQDAGAGAGAPAFHPP